MLVSSIMNCAEQNGTVTSKVNYLSQEAGDYHNYKKLFGTLSSYSGIEKLWIINSIL